MTNGVALEAARSRRARSYEREKEKVNRLRVYTMPGTMWPQGRCLVASNKIRQINILLLLIIINNNNKLIAILL